MENSYNNISSILRLYVLPVLIVTGCVLNSLSFYVMIHIHSTTGFYISILAIADTGNFKVKSFQKII